MTRKYSELRARMPQKNRDRAAARAAKMIREMPLQELRQARKLSQEALAEALGQRQSGVSKIEQRTDIYISTLRRCIEAMGGRLDIVAHFPDGDVRINQFKEIEAA
jgi:ribosome-binding protein aMBF1 (putative translation factor)